MSATFLLQDSSESVDEGIGDAFGGRVPSFDMPSGALWISEGEIQEWTFMENINMVRNIFVSFCITKIL